MARLRPEAAAVLAHPVPHEWYPVDYLRAMYEAVESEFGTNHPEVMMSLGAFMAEASVTGFLKYMVRLISVETAINRLNAIWGRYHNDGTAKGRIISVEGNKKKGILTVEDYDGGELWCKLMDGFIRVFVAATGAKNVDSEKQTCIHKGEKNCSWLVSWEE